MVHAPGRSLAAGIPEARAGTGMLEACLTPELAIEITAQPVRRHRVDAAIFFSDIVVPLRLAGLAWNRARYRPGVASRCAPRPTSRPYRPLTPHALAPIIARCGGLAELGATPLIGFAGAPFTLASYLVEGGPSREHLRTKALMHAEPTPGTARGLGRRPPAAFLRAQVLAGAVRGAAVRLLGGFLSRPDYAVSSLEHSAAVFAASPT